MEKKVGCVEYVWYVRVDRGQSMRFERGRMQASFMLWIRHYGDGDNSARILDRAFKFDRIPLLRLPTDGAY